MTDLDRAIDLVRNARNLCILTGAGLSTASGIPDFRGPDGVWTKDPEAEKLSDIMHFRTSPAMRVKHWANPGYRAMAAATPNAGHEAIHALHPSLLVTQNVDGLHLKAGDHALEMHGNIRTTHCLGDAHVFSTNEVLALIDSGSLGPDPACTYCDEPLKRDIVFFGEDLPYDMFSRAKDFAEEYCDVMLCVGTTLSVYPVADLPLIAKRHTAKIIVVNNSATDFDSRADILLNDDINLILSAMADLS